MSEQSCNEEMKAVVQRLDAARRLLVVTHARPDGDGLGAMCALARSAVAAGKTARTLAPDKVPARYEFVFAGQLPAGAEQFDGLADEAEVIVVIDTSARKQLDGIDEALLARRDKVVVIDHHATSERIGSAQWVDSSAAAAGVMVGEAVAALEWPLDLVAAEALMVAITSDTGWLRFANTDGRCLRAVAGLLDAGVRPDELYLKLFQSDRPQRMMLMVRMLQSLQLSCGGRLATMVIRKADFTASGALPEETENLVNEPMRMGCMDTSVLLVENGGVVRASLRSRGAIDVAAIAATFGGGGHSRAAGLRAQMDIDQLRQKLTEICCKALEG